MFSVARLAWTITEIMNDLLTDPKAWVIGLLAILGGIVAWFFQRELTRIDKAISEMVPRDEFTQLRNDMDRRHTENVKKLDNIGEVLGEIRTKVAVLRDRAGDDPLVETGSHRRRL